MVKYPKRFCYYCNHIIDCKRQSFVKCCGCETFCHTDCIDFECDQNNQVKNIKKSRQKKFKTAIENENCSVTASYTCSKCCLKVTPFSDIITNSNYNKFKQN